MRRPALLLVAGALALPLLGGVAPGSEAASEVRHYLEADQVGTSGYEYASDVTAGGGLVAASGSTAGQLPDQTSSGAVDAFVRVDDSDLDPLWTQQFGTPADDWADSVSTNGSLVVASGSTKGDLVSPNAGGFDAWLRAWNSDGTDAWTRQFGGTGDEGAWNVVVQPDAVYVAGVRRGNRGFVRRYTLAGHLRWNRDIDAGSVNRMVVLGDHIYVILRSRFTDEGNISYLAGLSTASGGYEWEEQIYVTGDLASDGDRLYVAGRISEGLVHGVVEAYSLRGRYLWTSPTVRSPSGEAYSDVVSAAWDGSSIIAIYYGASHYAIAAISTARRIRWLRPMPDDLVPVSMSHSAHGLYIGGGTDASLAGPTAGGRDAAIARFGTYQPDARARYFHDDDLIGDDMYGGRQRLVVTVEGVKPRSVAISAQNDGEVAQQLRVSGCTGHDGYRVRYLDSTGTDVTDAVTGTGYSTPALAPDAQQSLRVVITPLRRTTGSTTCKAAVTSASDDRDAVTLAIRRR
jgi:hypothetical protein